jgi:hypothetical protein
MHCPVVLTSNHIIVFDYLADRIQVSMHVPKYSLCRHTHTQLLCVHATLDPPPHTHLPVAAFIVVPADVALRHLTLERNLHLHM